AEALAREAGAAFLPEIGAGASAARSQVSTRTLPALPAGAPRERSLYQASASTSFELDFWGRFARANEAARANLLGSRLAQDTVALSLAGATAQAYFALRSLDAQLAVLEGTLRVRGDTLAIARARLEAGLASELDVHQAQGALSDAMAQRREVERARALVERQLATLTGRLELRLERGDLLALPVPPAPPAGLPSALLERRPDIRAAEEALVAANAQIGIARAALFPALSLTAAFGAQSAELGQLLSGGAIFWSLGAGVAASIFDAGRREARVEQSEARRDQVLAGYQRAIETAFREVADALSNVALSAQVEQELEQRVAAARGALELSTLRYDAGYSPYLEVLDAQRSANEAELAFVRNRQARLAFSVDLMRALGGGWNSESNSGSGS
ncbi:MAG TPA: efflux transporter outer membrane subunit, partial [Burkholderiales bacterium]|nr:efflux transporter outer membrane subunit [Burkholderiales bacterium]